MESNAVIKGTSYVLVHTPDFVVHNGTTQRVERKARPNSDYLKKLSDHIRSYEQAIKYPPNQVYIGNLTPEELGSIDFPWHDKEAAGAQRYGQWGEIMPADEFVGLVQICDVFDLVVLEKSFAARVKEKLSSHPVIDKNLKDRFKAGVDRADMLRYIEDNRAEAIYWEGEIIGYVKRAHDIDESLSAHVLFENLVYKASGVLSLLYLIKNTGIDRGEVDYVIDCSEEACGDMNQRGGGNFAKAQAEMAGLVNATGSDTRSFCAGPAHAIIEAAALVKAGVYNNVIVFAGGTTAKLGMNAKDHVKKGMLVLEDVLGGFALLISNNDGISPEINLRLTGRHTVGTGSSPQAVLTSLVTEPLSRVNLKVTDIDKYAAEMQNPDITKPAGAGDVPEANYKMIAALAVKKGQLDRSAMGDFILNHGMVGWAPTQGHIPSGVPYLGFAREAILEGKINSAMLIGKGSLFLGRMTNLFDGVSFVVQSNKGLQDDSNSTKDKPSVRLPVVGLAAEDSELGMEVILEGISIAEKKGWKTILIDGKDPHQRMEEMLANGEIDAAVTMHYPFPLGVSTVGRIITPGMGREMYISTTTGASSTNRVEGLVKNAVYGIIVAKASGVKNPSVGIANIEGARQAEKALMKLKNAGYDIGFAQTKRKDGGAIMRGNDMISGSADIMVMDSLTGNLMMKIFSAYTTGGSYESIGYGYGPGVGEDFNKIILIISRASGSPVIAGAIEYAVQLIMNNFITIARDEIQKANRAGLQSILEEINVKKEETGDESKITPPQKEVVTEEIHGIEVMDIEDAVHVLWQEGIYAESGMGCTGPVVLIASHNMEQVRKILSERGYIH